MRKFLSESLLFNPSVVSEPSNSHEFFVPMASNDETPHSAASKHSAVIVVDSNTTKHPISFNSSAFLVCIPQHTLLDVNHDLPSNNSMGKLGPVHHPGPINFGVATQAHEIKASPPAPLASFALVLGTSPIIVPIFEFKFLVPWPMLLPPLLASLTTASWIRMPTIMSRSCLFVGYSLENLSYKCLDLRIGLSGLRMAIWSAIKHALLPKAFISDQPPERKKKKETQPCLEETGRELNFSLLFLSKNLIWNPEISPLQEASGSALLFPLLSVGFSLWVRNSGPFGFPVSRELSSSMPPAFRQSAAPVLAGELWFLIVLSV
ncbi:hypothetical protein SLEP1_g44097 [Rubroshorea leprosula]|uniref:Uncharacterized protein n=1 Tax=Rubroshorea leprosula TaxID=152421 RepID=A0AAV5LF63_9ROSI|nr:hypothetical protein SLEP1_g44097 [Rubroshorea leprosula]